MHVSSNNWLANKAGAILTCSTNKVFAESRSQAHSLILPTLQSTLTRSLPRNHSSRQKPTPSVPVPPPSFGKSLLRVMYNCYVVSGARCHLGHGGSLLGYSGGVGFAEVHEAGNRYSLPFMLGLFPLCDLERRARPPAVLLSASTGRRGWRSQQKIGTKVMF